MQMLSTPKTYELESYQNSEGQSNNFATLQPELPSWLSTDYNKQISELMDSYKGINSAYDPTEQIQARERNAQNVLALGNSAANSAANEYANRAQLSGGSALGAGAMRAQLLFQSMNQANTLKGEASDIAAASRQKANEAALGAAATMGGIRNNYLGTLASYYANLQQSLNQQAQIRMQGDIANRQLDLEEQKIDANAPKQLQLFYNGSQIPWGNTTGMDRSLLEQRYVNI